MILTQIFHLILQTSVDPQTQQLLQSLAQKWLPILDALAFASGILVTVKLGWLLTHNPQERGSHFILWVWGLVGVVIIFGASVIANIWCANAAGLF